MTATKFIMTFAAIAAQGGGDTVLINASAVTYVQDNGDGTSTIALSTGGPFRSSLAQAAVISALGLVVINVTRANETTPLAVNTSAIITAEAAPPISGQACTALLLDGGQVVKVLASPASIIAQLDTNRFLSITRLGSATHTALAFSRIRQIYQTFGVNGIEGSNIVTTDGRCIAVQDTAATVLATMNTLALAP